MKEYERWLEFAEDPDIKRELSELEGDAERIKDAFYKHLEFGTGGLRGILGAGTNRMNIYTVRRATLGLSRYLLRKNTAPCVVVGYDTRINSELFAREAARALAASGIKAYLFKAPLPTPTLSYAVRSLFCDAGIMITASHNPKEYNGYKVFGKDGCQITDLAAGEILSEINAADYFERLCGSLDELIADLKAEYIPDELLTRFLDTVSQNSVLFGDNCDKSVSIVYTPLNGTGYIPVTRVLKENGYESLTVVREQAIPDGNFPTCPYPNPEIKEALKLGLEYADSVSADILLATDPDSDRVGVAVRNDSGYRILSGNEVGILLFDYIINQRNAHNRMPKSPKAFKTVVTTELARRIAESRGVEMKSLLTGFKYIGEAVGALEARQDADSFIFGFEESCGYLPGTYVRDKDGVAAAFLVAEMAAFYKAFGKSIYERLLEIYAEHGFSKTRLVSYAFLGEAGFFKMREIMNALRENKKSPAGLSPMRCEDYLLGVSGLPTSDVLKFYFENATAALRPSGTEPKLKLYIEAFGKNESESDALVEKIYSAFDSKIKEYVG